MTAAKPSWRDILPIHPAGDLFPPMSLDELRALGADIVKRGLTAPIALWRAHPKMQAQLLDGRNRLVNTVIMKWRERRGLEPIGDNPEFPVTKRGPAEPLGNNVKRKRKNVETEHE
jgi:hypothetical protein